MIVGLTGGIASGKSAVSRYLSELGAWVVDADAVAHDVIAPDGSAYDGVVERFGKQILDPDGRIDRDLLGQIVFGDPQAMADLNAIVHPKIHAESTRRLVEGAAESGAAIAIYDAALLVETGIHDRFERLIVVACDRETQIERLADRDGYSRAKAEARIDAQLPLEEKVAQADFVIDTDTTLERTRQETARVYQALLELAAGRA